MQCILPTTVTDAMLVSSSVPETDYPAYSSGTTYAAGARVIVAAAHRCYESLVAGNIGNAPATSPAQWLDIGPTNRWACFDGLVGTATTAATSIEIVINPGMVDSIALLDTYADSIIIVGRMSGTEIYRKEFYPANSNAEINNWYDFFFSQVGRVSTSIATDLPIYGTVEYTITVNSATTASIGTIVVGRVKNIGKTKYGLSPEIRDFSKKSVSDLGVVSLVKRSFAKDMTVPLVIDNGDIDRVYRLMSQLISTPVVWIAGPYECTVVYGWYEGFKPQIEYSTHSLCTINIKGLS